MKKEDQLVPKHISCLERKFEKYTIYYIHGQAKKNHLGVKFPGYNSKNLPATFGGMKIFPPATPPKGTK